MTVKDLIEQLSVFEDNKIVTVFTEGKCYPTLLVYETDTRNVELGCGWVHLEEEEC